MGLDWSAPPGRAEFPSCLFPFTIWGKEDLRMMKRRHAASLGGTYALHSRHFAELLATDRFTSDPIFHLIDTDANSLVDAFESMCVLALVCSATLAEKVDFMHSLFDFRLDGDLTLPEVTILVRTAIIACAKLDVRVQVPPTEAIEGLCRMAFDEVRVDDEGVLARHLFESFVFRDAQTAAFLQLWSGGVSQVLVPDGELWEDVDFPADESALSLVAGIVPPGMPPSGVVRWLRPSEVARGDEPVLFVGDMPGSSSIVAGQLADRWLLSAIGILTGHPQLLRSLFLPTHQEATGRYCIRIFKEANWTNVFVDNRVACNALGEALFCHGEERHELWGFLLEKAFAKAHGCYENLMHGDTCEALRDLTGGAADKLQWQLTGTSSSMESTVVAAASQTSIAPQQKKKNVQTVAAVQREASRVAAVGDEGKPRPRVSGWGVPAGTMQPFGWIFEEIRDRLLEGHVLGCSRHNWVRCPWEDGGGQELAHDEPLFPPSNRVMRGLCSGVSYCVLEAFESGDVRLVRLRDPWAAQQGGAEPGEYPGDWGPSSQQWAVRPTLASELLPRTLRGMFWMDMDAFLEVFNTLYSVDLTGGEPALSPEEIKKARRRQTATKTRQSSSASSSIHAPIDRGVPGAGSKEGRCQGSWEGERCGGRFTDGKGWLQGTQAFLQIEPSRPNSGDNTAQAKIVPSSGATKKYTNLEEDVARVVITVTQEDSRYHHRNYTERQERRRSIGFLVHSHAWSTESKRDIPKLSKILRKDTKYLSRPFVPRRDVSCHLALSPGQYVIVPTTLEAGMAGRFWVHVKSDRNFTLQPSFPKAQVSSATAGECEIALKEDGMAVEAAYNEVEEDAEGNGMTANAAILGGLLASAQALAAKQAAIKYGVKVT